ncbi:MAG: hypothetical protein ISS57_18800 [Anaerolineales bacterium]|nr:hypothetical protein [Anaerolineales bacterium]
MEGKVYFLDDEPIDDLRKFDAFGHVYYARTLLRILELTDSIKPYAIGLFGEWGVGKTSIILEMERIIREQRDKKESTLKHNYRIIKLDTWEYSDNNFRREFLLDLGIHFGCRDEIRARITSKKIKEIKEAPQYTRAWFSRLLVQLGFTFIILIIVSLIQRLSTWQLDTTFLPSWFPLPLLIVSTAAILFSLVAVFQENIKQLFSFHTTIFEVEPPIHADEFREIFNRVIEDKAKLNKDDDRLVIILDNLDRVKEEIVIQILGAVKTFLRKEKCIYILPCDEKGLKQHITNMGYGKRANRTITEAQANEYLRKFFQTTLPIRNLLIEDLEAFIDHTLDQLELFNLPNTFIELDVLEEAFDSDQINKQNRNSVSYVLRVALSKNPRRIKQLSNKLASNYILAIERSDSDPELTKNIITHLGFLAKISIIEEEWTHFYALILEDPDVLRKIRSYFITGNMEDLPNKLFKALSDPQNSSISYEWENGLEDFLRRTETIHSDFVDDFLNLKQKQVLTQISNYYAFHDAALSGDFDAVNSILQNERTDVDAACKNRLST